jgi:hypothetical protein
MWRKLMPAAVALGALAALGVGASAEAKPDDTGRACFASTQWRGWQPTANGDALYLKVGLKDVYRVDLSPGAHARRGPGDFLVTKSRGSNWICSALDLDLSISDDMGFRRPLIATNLRKLSPAEIAAIPRKERP